LVLSSFLALALEQGTGYNEPTFSKYYNNIITSVRLKKVNLLDTTFTATKLLYISNIALFLQIKLPRLMQGVVAAFGDYYVYKFSWLLCDRATAQWTLLCQTVNWFMLYCATRTLTNSMETVLVIAAMYYFPWPSKYSQR